MPQKKMLIRVLIWTVAALGVGGIIFGMVKLAARSNVAGNAGALSAPVSSIDKVRGNASSKVVLVEYSDFQCPACGVYYPVLKQVHQEFGSEIAFVYRHFPLSQHANAKPAAKAAEAAGAQGKFWEMHDMIFEHQKDWPEESNGEEIFLSYAQTLGLDMEKFKRDRDSEETADKIDGDYEGGISSGVNSTPTFYLNGKKLQNPRSYDEFRNTVRQSIEASR